MESAGRGGLSAAPVGLDPRRPRSSRFGRIGASHKSNLQSAEGPGYTLRGWDMPTSSALRKNEILLQYCKDLQALDAAHDGEVAGLEAERLKRVADVPAGRALVQAAEAARGAAAAELSTDRERAAAVRDAAMAVVADKRREQFAANDQARQKAERSAERARDDRRTEENRKHEDALEKIARSLPLSQQALPRAEEVARHEKELARIQADFEVAWDRAREDFQAANESVSQVERRASELANDAHQEAVRVAELHYRTTLDAAATKLHDGLLKCAETRAIEEEMEQRARELQRQWQEKREALHARFKRDYDAAPALPRARTPWPAHPPSRRRLPLGGAGRASATAQPEATRSPRR